MSLFEDDGDRSAKHLAKGWRRMLKRAAAAREACKDTTDAHLFHELRKRSQDYRYYLDLLQPLWPSAMHAKRVEATKVVDLLGHHNDLALLSSLVNEQPELFGKSEDLAHLLSAVIYAAGSAAEGNPCGRGVGFPRRSDGRKPENPTVVAGCRLTKTAPFVLGIDAAISWQYGAACPARPDCSTSSSFCAPTAGR